MIELTGVTWGHIRAIDPLRVASLSYSHLFKDVSVQWNVRTLADFEHQPLEELVQHVDFVVFDHPYCGKLFNEQIFEPLKLAGLEADKASNFIGRSLETYQYRGRTMGAPIDGATNHAVYRQDLLEAVGAEVPKSWQDVIDLGHRVQLEGKKLGFAARGHHGLLVLAALCANAGKPWGTTVGEPFAIDKDCLSDCVDALLELLPLCSAESCDWNAIDLHNAMTLRDDIVYTPCVYGYAVYGEKNIYQNRLAFSNLPGRYEPFEAGSVIGGAAIGMSAFCKYKAEAQNYLSWLLKAEVQSDYFAAFHGQPARVECWDNAEIDDRFNGYYSSIRRSMETAWIRPRFYGYQEFESQSGDRLELLLRGNISKQTFMNDVLELSVRHFRSW
ncbi:extracellular solute-binding protein [Rhodobacteraceae bacterium RKSG542]|uniref:extracellular solute-binding protein n=1 Tax=Pseudovibrio flavus TaxID=2529854 RepID=UPI0012BC6B15|nr:extracellular solute-binding protein [Pseudovibrio flavus]MTI15909.1 extracellular solute-binding protein [Pseudovibrio flavus]